GVAGRLARRRARGGLAVRRATPRAGAGDAGRAGNGRGRGWDGRLAGGGGPAPRGPVPRARWLIATGVGTAGGRPAAGGRDRALGGCTRRSARAAGHAPPARGAEAGPLPPGLPPGPPGDPR